MQISSYYLASAKVQRFIKEGRGQGIGMEYKPWTKTYEYSSKGRVTRLLGVKIPRIYHLQSDNQYRAFMLFEFCEKVSDIRESFPLLDVMEVVDSKDDLRFDKFWDKEKNEPYVITTNFILTLRDADGNERYVARTVKNTSELKRKITWEKLEVERRYWHQKGIEWKVITEKQLPRQLAKNIEWVRETLLEGSESGMNKEELSILLLREIYNNDDQPVKQVLKMFDKNEGLQKGSGLFLFRYLIAKKEVQVDMNQKIDFTATVRNLIL